MPSWSEPVTTPESLYAFLDRLLVPETLLELACVAGLLGLLYVVVRRLRPDEASPDSVWFGSRVVDGLMFPLLAWAGVQALAKGLHKLTPGHLFSILVPVFMSLAIIRMTARILRAAFPASQLTRVIERVVSWLAWCGVILWELGILPMVWDELDSIHFKLGSNRLTVAVMIEGLLTASVVLMLALWVSAALERRLLRGAEADHLSLRKIVAKLLRAGLLTVGMLVALSTAGIDITALGVLGGALGVGLGFGLQKLAANYVSGFVVLAERSLRIGDMVRVDGFEGRISDIKTRYTVIRALNGRESIVPNETLLTTRVENLSLADPTVLVSAVVQVAYGSPLDTLMPQVAEAVAAVPRVLADPAPSVQLSQFAADGLELTVNFWIRDPENGQGSVRSEVNLALWRLLQAQGIDIPSPQRVVRVLHEAPAQA